MRILHTSDWHLGVEYFQRPRGAEQAAFLDWLLTAIEEHNVDVLVVAGDVFDTVNPPAEALQLYYRFLARLSAQSRGCTAIIVGGNHDSASRLDAPRHVLASLSTHVVGGHDPERAGLSGDAAGQLVPCHDADGELAAVVAAVPFLNEWRIGVRGFDVPPAEQRKNLQQAFREVYSRLADKAQARFGDVPLLATGHLTCLAQAGDKPSDADAIPNEINRVGALGAMGPGIFDERYSYVALGHIHRGFAVDAGQRVWYSGTPVQVGAEEPWEARQVLLVDIPEGGAAPRIEPLIVPTKRRILRLRGEVDDVRAQLASLAWGALEEPPYVLLEATLQAPQPGLRDALRELAPHGANGKAQVVEVKASVARRAGAGTAAEPADLPTGESVTPEAAFRFAWQAKHGEVEPSEHVMERFRLLLEVVGDDAPAA